ncbi:MAG: hypothetical protein V3U80_10145 [Flavobacteriaceae bacterium]
MKISIQILIILVLISCSKRNKNQTEIKQERTIAKSEFSQIVFLDKFSNELILDTLKLETDITYSPIYIGKKSDTLNLTYQPSKMKFRTMEWFKYKKPNSNRIKIFIDTSRIIGSSMGIWEYYKASEYRLNKKAYPVFIENIGKDTLSIGFGDILPIVTEAKDSIGNWKPLHRQFIYSCGTGLSEFYLPPKHLSLTTMKLYYGDYKTKLRIAFRLGDKKIVSNEINGFVDYEFLK